MEAPQTWEQALTRITNLVRAELQHPGELAQTRQEFLWELEQWLHTDYLPGMAVTAIVFYPDPAGNIIRIAELVTEKQRDYGKTNILKFGLQGVAVRVSDKIERLKNLALTGADPGCEPVQDSWDDIVGYGLVGLLVQCGWFGLPLEKGN